MSIFSKFFHSDYQNEKNESDLASELVSFSENELPTAPTLTKGLEARKKRDYMVSQGYDLPKSSDLSFIDDNGNCVII